MTISLKSFVGKKFESIKTDLCAIFAPYTLLSVDEPTFYLNNYYTNQIRYVVKDGIVTHIQFN